MCEHVRAYERDRESESDFNKAAQTHTRPQNFLHYARSGSNSGDSRDVATHRRRRQTLNGNRAVGYLCVCLQAHDDEVCGIAGKRGGLPNFFDSKDRRANRTCVTI